MSVEFARKKMILRLLRLDADDPEDEDEDPEEEKKGFGGRNTRLPFGLCKRFGIDLPDGATPRDAWDALAGKGVSARGAYSYLQKNGTIEGYEPEKDEPAKNKPAGGSKGNTSKAETRKVIDNHTYIRGEGDFSKSLPDGAGSFHNRTIKFNNLHDEPYFKGRAKAIETHPLDAKTTHVILNAVKNPGTVVSYGGLTYISRGGVWECVSDADNNPKDNGGDCFRESGGLANDIRHYYLAHRHYNTSPPYGVTYDIPDEDRIKIQQYDSAEIYTPESWKHNDTIEPWNPCEDTTPVKRDKKYFGECITEHEHKGTASEAQKYLSNKLGIPVTYGHSQYGSYKGYMSAETANKFNDAFLSLCEALGLKNIKCVKSSGNATTFSMEIVSLYEVTSDGEGAVEFRIGDIYKLDAQHADYFDKKFATEKAEYKDAVKKLEALQKDIDNNGPTPDKTAKKNELNNIINKLSDYKYEYGSSYYEPGKRIESVVAHEIGHVLMTAKLFDIDESGVKKAMDRAIDNGDIYKLSKYAEYNSDEFFAEVFAICTMGHADELPDYMVRMVEKYIYG